MPLIVPDSSKAHEVSGLLYIRNIMVNYSSKEHVKVCCPTE